MLHFDVVLEEFWGDWGVSYCIDKVTLRPGHIYLECPFDLQVGHG